MKVTKSLLLGAAAGFVAMSGAQAADLPVKAKPVEYVKICTAYGAGFYYIPGTDICLRVGGYVFVETGVKGAGAAVDQIFHSTEADAQFTADDNYANWRARGHVILDARNNTAYGTLRAYFVGGVSYQDIDPTGQNRPAGNTVASMDRAFIQFAGFTAGFTESFFSFGGAYSIVSSNALSWDWLPLIAYTAQLGNGVSATLSIQDGNSMRSGIIGPTTDAYGGNNAPDIVANLRVDQAWGSAQIMGALHEVRQNVVGLANGGDHEWGYAVGGGFEIKTPQTGNPSNSFLLQGVWSKGAVEYTGLRGNPVLGSGPVLGHIKGATGAVSTIDDAVNTGISTELTEAWSAYAAYRHYWTPMLRTGFSFGLTDVDYSAAAKTLAVGGAQNDIRLYQGHVSTIWSPVAGLDLSLDLVYTKLKTNNCELGFSISQCAGSEDIWTAWTRIRRNF